MVSARLLLYVLPSTRTVHLTSTSITAPETVYGALVVVTGMVAAAVVLDSDGSDVMEPFSVSVLVSSVC